MSIPLLTHRTPCVRQGRYDYLNMHGDFVRIPFELSVFLHVLLKSESRIDLFRLTLVRSCSMPPGPGPGATGPSGFPGPGLASRAGVGL